MPHFCPTCGSPRVVQSTSRSCSNCGALLANTPSLPSAQPVLPSLPKRTSHKRRSLIIMGLITLVIVAVILLLMPSLPLQGLLGRSHSGHAKLGDTREDFIAAFGQPSSTYGAQVQFQTATSTITISLVKDRAASVFVVSKTGWPDIDSARQACQQFLPADAQPDDQPGDSGLLIVTDRYKSAAIATQVPVSILGQASDGNFSMNYETINPPTYSRCEIVVGI